MIDLSKKIDLQITELYNYFIFYLPKEAIANAFKVNGISTKKIKSIRTFFLNKKWTKEDAVVFLFETIFLVKKLIFNFTKQLLTDLPFNLFF